MQKFGVREICEVVLKAKAAMKVGNKVFYKNEPVMYFDTLKTSSMEGAATTVYAQGGRGNSRLVAWEGERTVTFTMEDALISAESFMILSGAGLIDAKAGRPIYQHVVEQLDETYVKDNGSNGIDLYLDNEPYLPLTESGYAGENYAYVMFVNHHNGEMSEPYIPEHLGVEDKSDPTATRLYLVEDPNSPFYGKYKITIKTHTNYMYDEDHKEFYMGEQSKEYQVADAIMLGHGHFIVDYYTAKESDARQIEITPDKFGGNFYLEASTLFRDTNGVDMPAEFIIPNCKIQSNFTFTMAASGDPSTFTFTMDAFPDYTRFDHSKKVLAAIQIIETAGTKEIIRNSTRHENAHEEYFK